MYKFAIVGCGRIARRHIQHILEWGSLMAVCDVNEEKANAFAKEFGVNKYYNLDDLLKAEKEINIISVCSPNGFHAEHSIKSLQAGLHVLCEKPMCITGSAAWQMIETEKFSRKKLFIVKSARFNPLIKGLKKVIEEGELGKIYSFSLQLLWNRPPHYYNDWHGKMFPDGGTLYTQFSHYIDTILWLFGDVQTVTGYADKFSDKHGLEFEDTGTVAVKLLSGTLGTIHWSVNTYEKNSEISLVVIAEKGTVSFGGEYLNELKYTQLPKNISFEASSTLPNEYVDFKGSMSHHSEVYESMIKNLKSQEIKSNAMDGLKTVEAIEKIYKAVR